jgi:hypothetical protein
MWHWNTHLAAKHTELPLTSRKLRRRSNAVSRTKNVLRYGFQSRSYVDKWETLCDDPTFEESIECVFDHQLQEGIEMNVEDDDTALDKSYNEDEVQYYNSGKLVLVGSFSTFAKDANFTDSDTTIYSRRMKNLDELLSLILNLIYLRGLCNCAFEMLK